MRRLFAHPSTRRAAVLAALLLPLPVLGGCSLFGDDEMTLADMPGDLAVDAFLWQGALDTLAVLPPGTQSPSTGRIETGWGNMSGNPGELVKVVVQIYPGPLSAASVAVVVQRTVNGVPAGVNPSTAPEVQNAILLRARQLKSSLEDY